MSEVKRYDIEADTPYACIHHYDREDGDWVKFEDYADLQRENESNLKSAQYSAETNRKVVRTNEVLSDKLAALQQKLDAVLAENVALVAEMVNIREQAEDVYAAGYNHGHLNTVDGIAYTATVEDEFFHNAMQVMAEVETPATDAILNEVRAEGIDYLASEAGEMTQKFKQGSSDWKRWKSIVFFAVTVAAKLRAGSTEGGV